MRAGRNSDNKARVELALIAGGVLLGIIIAVQSIGMTLAGG
jgi:Flp pilus assembly pilin Flp